MLDSSLEFRVKHEFPTPPFHILPPGSNPHPNSTEKAMQIQEKLGISYVA